MKVQGKGKKVAAAPLVTKKPAPPRKVQNCLIRSPETLALVSFSFCLAIKGEAALDVL